MKSTIEEHGVDPPPQKPKTPVATSSAISNNSTVITMDRRESLGTTQFTGLRGRDNLRKRLPVPMFSRNDVSLFSMFRQAIGKDLSRIALPVTLNEPLSFLQRLAEYLEYAYLIEIASEKKDLIERMEIITAFAVSSLSSNHERLGKPFNPLLGETYELDRHDLPYKLISEQVSHHPPISAFHAESPIFEFTGHILPNTTFVGKNIEVRPDGYICLHLKKWNETYLWSTIPLRVHNIFIGKLWIEHYGTMTIDCLENGWKTELNFQKSFREAYFGTTFFHVVDGFLYDNKENKRRAFCGRWIDSLYSFDVNGWCDYEGRKTMTKCVKNNKSDVVSVGIRRMKSLGDKSPFKTLRRWSADSQVELEVKDDGGGSSGGGGDDGDSSNTNNSGGEVKFSNITNNLPGKRLLWKGETKNSENQKYYNFSDFAMSLNELTLEIMDKLPPTDSRFRPDLRELEEGNVDNAGSEKHRLETKQRDGRQKKKSYGQTWFVRGRNPLSDKIEWVFTKQYWKRNWSDCPNIF